MDGIPHLAMVNADGEVETAIIGTVPKNVSLALAYPSLSLLRLWGREPCISVASGRGLCWTCRKVRAHAPQISSFLFGKKPFLCSLWHVD